MARLMALSDSLQAEASRFPLPYPRQELLRRGKLMGRKYTIHLFG